jgi:hypothetical protein
VVEFARRALKGSSVAPASTSKPNGAEGVAAKSTPALEIDATSDKLLRLGLEYAAAALAGELAEAVKHNRPGHSIVGRLLTYELAARDERRIKTS